MNEAINLALRNYLPQVLPEAVLGAVACLLFLGATLRGGRSLWGCAALVGLGLAAAALVYTAVEVPTIQAMQTPPRRDPTTGGRRSNRNKTIYAR